MLNGYQPPTELCNLELPPLKDVDPIQHYGIISVHPIYGTFGNLQTLNRVATFRFRLNSLCFPCVYNQFPCVFQYINNKYYFYKWPPPPLTAILSSILFNNNITS